MDRRGAIIKRPALEPGKLFVDTLAAFDAALEDYDPLTPACDRVHPTHIGAMILARAFLQSIDCAW